MRYFILIIFICSTLISYGQDSYYGEKITKESVVAFDDALKTNSAEVKIQGEIIQTCSKKGCWMTLSIPNREEIRVTFKDYGFFVPKEGMEGKNAILQGQLIKSITDVETLRHFAEDAGKSKEEIAAITEPKEEYSFIASGVIIED